MNQTIARIKEKIINYQDLKILDEKDNYLRVQPDGENTFPITVIAEENKFKIYFLGWNQEFFNEEEALDCFAFGLSDDCRLKVISVAAVEFKWILEVKEKGQWIEESETSLALFPFWQKKVVSYFQNKIIDSGS